VSVTILIPATAKALTNLQNVRGDLGLASDTPSDTQIQRFIAQASSRAATFCRRTFGRETVRERFGCQVPDCGGALGLPLDRAPLVRILSVSVDGVVMADGSYETDDRFLYRLQDGERRGWTGRSVVVDYEAGWLLPSEARGTPPTTIAPDLPPDVERAIIQLVGVAISAGGRDAMVKSQSVEGIGSTDWYVQGASASLPHPEAEAALSQYRRLHFA
jgi:hypothetical protein